MPLWQESQKSWDDSVQFFREDKMPKPVVQLTGENGNVYNLLSICVRALRKEGMVDEAEKLKADVMAAEDYDHALRLMMEACEVQ
jgi:hypothetical protein